jgi:hypothetical protein
MDLAPDGKRGAEALAKKIVRTLRWKGPWHLVSAINGAGCRELSGQVYTFLKAQDGKKGARRAAA